MVLRLMAGETAQRVREEITQFWASAEGDVESSSASEKQSASEGEGKNRKPIPLMTLRREAERAIEHQAIQYALRASGGNKRKAARILNISYKTLYNKLATLGLDIPPKASYKVR
jgi:DNA-binding NtrC family response regulator